MTFYNLRVFPAGDFNGIMSEAAYGTAKAQHWIVEEGDDESRLKALKERCVASPRAWPAPLPVTRVWMWRGHRIDNTPGYGSPQQLVLMKKAQAKNASPSRPVLLSGHLRLPSWASLLRCRAALRECCVDPSFISPAFWRCHPTRARVKGSSLRRH